MFAFMIELSPIHMLILIGVGGVVLGLPLLAVLLPTKKTEGLVAVSDEDGVCHHQNRHRFPRWWPASPGRA
jgi:hypothetical protein